MMWQAEAAKRSIKAMELVREGVRVATEQDIAQIITDTFRELGPRFEAVIHHDDNLCPTGGVVCIGGLVCSPDLSPGDASRFTDRLNSALHGGGA